MATLEDLEAAKTALQFELDRFDRYSGNNPNKYRTDITLAQMKVRQIEEQLKNQGVLERTEKERIWIELDKAFPNARSRQVVDYQGKKYRRRFSPASSSLSGKTVYEWNKWWEEA